MLAPKRTTRRCQSELPGAVMRAPALIVERAVDESLTQQRSQPWTTGSTDHDVTLPNDRTKRAYGTPTQAT